MIECCPICMISQVGDGRFIIAAEISIVIIAEIKW